MRRKLLKDGESRTSLTEGAQTGCSPWPKVAVESLNSSDQSAPVRRLR